MAAKRIGRPATGTTKTKKSVTIDDDILAKAEARISSMKGMSLSALVEVALESYLKDVPVVGLSALKDQASSPITALPSRAHILAAAGSPICAEVTDWDGADDTILVKIAGLSMAPLLNDGDIVPMKLKSVSRSPYMKKGLIYLVRYDGGLTVKRYNTRNPKPEEKGQEWVVDGKVKVLESENPEHPEIIIKQELEWVGWLEKETEKKLKASLAFT